MLTQLNEKGEVQSSTSHTAADMANVNANGNGTRSHVTASSALPCSVLESDVSIQPVQIESRLCLTSENKAKDLDQDMEEDLEEESEIDEDSDEDSDFDEDTCSLAEQELNAEAPLTDTEIQDFIDQLLQVESKAAEAQELLEEESLTVLKDEVKAELARKFSGLELDAAVEEEMSTYLEQWQEALEDLEDQSALLQERLDDAGVDLPALFKWIEKQAPQGCTTEAWKKRTHWAGLQASQEVVEVVSKAECDLGNLRPVKRHHGKFMEEGASGFIERKLSRVSADGSERVAQQVEGWESWDALLGNEEDAGKLSLFGGKTWASVYLASTPEQAALLGLPGADQVEEIIDLENCEKDPFTAAAVASEKESGLTEQQKKNIRKVREEDDIKSVRLMQRVTFKRKRGAGKSKNLSLSGAPEFEQCADTTGIEGTQCNETASSVLQNGVVSNEVVPFLETSIQSYGEEKTTTSVALRNRFLQDDIENPSKKAKLQVDDDDESKPCISGEGLGKSIQIDSKTPTAGLKICFKGEGSEAHNEKINRVVINIDSDEEQETERRKRPGTLPPEEFDDGVNDTKGCEGTSDFLCSRTFEASFKNNDDEGACIEDEQDEMKIAQKSSYFADQRDKILPTIRQDGKDFMCTCCGKKLKAYEVCRHPLFEIAICKLCRKFYQSGPFSKVVNGSEEECRWCGNGGDVIMCDLCDKVFCKVCIKLNFGEEELQRILKTEWLCFCCNSEPLKPLVECFREAGELVQRQSSEEDVSWYDEGVEVSNDKEYSELRNRREEKRRRRIRRIIEDDELDETTKQKLALEKERKERLDILRENAIASTSSYMPMSSSSQRCAINVARDVDEEEVLIPWAISKFLKPHQIEGVRFMWENCIESVKKVKSGDHGNGCILAHNMGLGKTLQVIAFLYTVLRNKLLGLRTALIVTPVNVLLNWPDEFEKWSPPELKQIPVYVLDDISRDKRGTFLSYWQKHGGVMMIGYTAFRILSLGRHIKDRSVWEKICKALQNPGPDILICDEAHMIKNKKADITQALKQVKTQRRIALTGSPLQNNLMEYYCMVDFVREGFLGRPQDFKNRFQNPIENGQHADSTEYDVRCMKERTHVLHKQLVGFVQRKGASVVEKELPPKFIYVISVRLSALQRALYNRFIQLFWLPSEQGSALKGSRKCLFNTYHALAKVWNHPDLLLLAKEEREIASEDSMDEFIVEDGEEISSDDGVQEPKKEDKKNGFRSVKRKDPDTSNEADALDWCHELMKGTERGDLKYSGKFVLLMDILAMSSTRGEKALVFSQSIPTLNLIETFLGKLSRPGEKGGYWRKDKEWYRLDGRTKAKERQRLVQRFNDTRNTKVQCVLISTKAGSLGINLQAANRVVIVDGSWNPTHDIQALFRAWRFGQKKPVVVYRLLAYGTAEEKIYKRQVAKEGLAARVLDEQQVGRHSKMEELKVLFKLDDDIIDMETGNGLLNPQVNGQAPIQMQNHLQVSFASPDVSDHDAPEDELMTSLLIDHRPSWIVRIHQHETLLEDREDEKLTQEEQALAWEKFRRITENSNVEWVQVNSESGEYVASQVQNSWASVQSARSSICLGQAHAELLLSRNIKNKEHVKCDICQQIVGWEHVIKGRPRT